MVLIPGSPEWVEARKGSVGGSDAGVLLRYDGYRGVLSLYKDKAGLEPDGYESNRFTGWGNRLEPAIIVRVAELTGHVLVGRMWDGRPYMFMPDGEVVPINVCPILDMIRHPDLPAHVNLDAVEFDDNGEYLRLWDAKNTGANKAPQWRQGFGPSKYVAQMVHARMVVRDALGYDLETGLAALVGGNLDVLMKVPYIPTLEAELRERIERFGECLRTGTPPKVNTMFPRLPDPYTIYQQERTGMPIYGGSKGGGGQNFKWPAFPEGTHHGVIVDVEDLGERESTWAGETKVKHEILVTVLFPDVLLPEADDDGKDFGDLAGKPRTARMWLTLSFHEKAALRKLARSLRGHDLTDEEEVLANESRLDVEQVILGLNGLFGVTNNKKGYPTIGDTVRLPSAMPTVSLEDTGYTRKSDQSDDNATKEDDDDLPF